MTYLKTSYISGKTVDGAFRTVHRNGYWSTSAAWKLARRMGLSRVQLAHHTHDMSGRGRSSEDARWGFAEDGRATRLPCRDDSDDAADVHEAWDAAEATEATEG